MSALDVLGCRLVGEFPSFICGGEAGDGIHVPLQQLIRRKSIPPGVWSLKELQRLVLFGNNLTGNIVVDGFAA